MSEASAIGAAAIQAIQGAGAGTKAHAPVSLYAFLFSPAVYPLASVEHLELDAEEHIADFSLASAGASERRVDNLRTLYVDEGENAVRARLGLPELPLQLFTDGTETYVACSSGDALAAQYKHIGENPNPSKDWYPLAAHETETIWLEGRGKGSPTTKTAAEWASERPRGFLCSTEE